MKEMLQLMAKYNKSANAGMCESMRKVKFDDLNKDVGIYYKSVLATAEHCLGGDMLMFGKVFNTYCEKPTVINDPILEMGSWKGVAPELKSNIDAFIGARIKVDEIIIKVINNIDDFSAIATLEFPGVKFEKPRYQIIAGILTHGTHHRGQIAAALDILGVHNDYAGMLGL